MTLVFAIQALNERYPEGSPTCSRETIGNYDIDYGGTFCPSLIY